MALTEEERSFVGRLAGRIERAQAMMGRIARAASRSSSAPQRPMWQDARQQVVVKVSYVKMCTKQGISKARAHLSYLERDGVAQDGSPGKLFDARGEVDRAAFWKRSEQDPHQFRIIISPEQGHKRECK